MKESKYFLTLLAAFLSLGTFAQTGSKLTGTVIGTEISIDYATNSPSTSVNTRYDAFDGDFNTFFASYDHDFSWVGLDLGSPHVITRVGFAARNHWYGPKRMCLSIFQGANNPDFSDALPIYLIPDEAPHSQMTYADVACSKGFRYVRYVGAHDGSCNVAELEFYGYQSSGDENALYQVTNLPTVVVNTPNMEWFHQNDKEYEMNGSNVTIITNGKIDVDASAQIRGRGNASWNFPKKPFRIKFDKKQKVLGGPAKAKKWTMINNYGDKTLMRNRLAFDISQRIGLDFTPACNFVDLVFNGEYQGTYQLCDQIEVNKDRVNITEMEKTDIEGDALTGGYLLEVDAYANQEAADEWFNTTKGYILPVTIKSPDAGVVQQYQYIRDRMSDLSGVMRTAAYTDPVSGYRSMMDLESFLRHFIVGELSGNTDTYWSVYMWLERGDPKFHFGPVWDFDLAFENDNRTYPINDKRDYIYRYGSSAGDMAMFVSRIVKTDAEAKDRLTYLWSYARECLGLDYDTFSDIIDNYAEQLAQSQELNFKRWPIMNTLVHQNPRVWGSYKAEVDNIKNYLRNRFLKLDDLIGRCEVEGIADILSDDHAPMQVYNLQGILVSDCLEGINPGLYIVRQGQNTRKVYIHN